MPVDPRLLGGKAEFHGPSPILENGQPYRRELTEADRELLGEEVAAPQLIGTRAFTGESMAAGMTPGRLAVVLQNARDGSIADYLTLAQDMEERDLSYAAALGTRKRALTRIRPTLDSEGVEPRIAAAVRQVIEDVAFHGLVKDLVDAIGKGFSACEIVWGHRDGLWWPFGYRYRDPKFFTFDYLSRSELRLADVELVDGLELPPAKFIRHLPKMKSGIPIRGGLAFTAAWAWMFKMFTLKDWMSFMDVYGMPLRLGKYHPGATEGERRALLRAVAGITSDAAAIIPESMQIEFIESKGFADQPFRNFGEYLDDQISTYVLGQTLTTRDGGSLGQAKVHNEIRLDLAEDDAFELEVTINRDLIAWFVGMNFGAQAKAPWCAFRVPKPEQVTVLATVLSLLVPLGLEVSQEDVRQRIGMPSPAPGATLLRSPAAGVASAVPTLQPGDVPLPGELPQPALNRVEAGAPPIAFATARAAIPVATLIDPMGFESEWQTADGLRIDTVVDAARTATSFDAFRDSLETMFRDHSTTGFSDRLQAATDAQASGRMIEHD